MIDFSEDSLHKLDILSEFGIGLDDIMPLAFKVVDQNFTTTEEERRKMIWEFIPEEESGGDPNDLYFFQTWDDTPQRNEKRECFITNAERIEVLFSEVMQEVIDNYKGSFSCMLDTNINGIRLEQIGDMSTCIHYWK